MKTLINFTRTFALILFTFFFISCDDTKMDDTEPMDKEVPVLEAGSDEYSEIVQKTIEILEAKDYEKLRNYMVDDINWYWPDGSSETRNKIAGIDNLIAFWNDWQETTGASISFTNPTFLPVKVNTPSNHYKLTGQAVFTYVDLTITMGDASTSVRQHMVFSFNDEMKITNCLMYYDRTKIIELTNIMLDEVG